MFTLRNIKLGMKISNKNNPHCIRSKLKKNNSLDMTGGRLPKRIKRYKKTSATTNFLVGDKQDDCSRKNELENPLNYFNKVFCETNGKVLQSKCTSITKEDFFQHSAHVNDVNEETISTELNLNKSSIVSLDTESIQCKFQYQALARCSIVDYNGNVLLDLYVKSPPELPVTSYLYKYSGIKEEDLTGDHVVTYKTAQIMVGEIIRGKILIGHSLRNDLMALGISHPLTIDVSTSKTLQKLMKKAAKSSNDIKVQRTPYSLKKLAKYILEKNIQIHSHCSVEDARTTMLLFHQAENEYISKLQDILSNEEDSASHYLSDKYWPKGIKND